MKISYPCPFLLPSHNNSFHSAVDTSLNNPQSSNKLAKKKQHIITIAFSPHFCPGWWTWDAVGSENFSHGDYCIVNRHSTNSRQYLLLVVSISLFW